MMMKNRAWFWTLTVVLALTSTICPVLGDENKPPENKVAVVNGRVITEEEFDMELGFLFSRMGKPPDDAQLSKVKKRALESMINRELLYQEALKNGIKIEDKAVNDRLKTLKGEKLPNEPDFKTRMDEHKISEAFITSQVKKSMAIQELSDKIVAGKIAIPENEVRAYYDKYPQFFKQPEQVRARHILIKVDPGTDESKKAEALKKIKDIQGKLQKGGDFEALAREFSEGRSKINGGDVGYFSRRRMVKPFEEVAFTLKPGEISDIVETKFGYHIIKVTDKKTETIVPYEDAEGRIKQLLTQKKIQEEMRLYADKLKKQGKVETFITIN